MLVELYVVVIHVGYIIVQVVVQDLPYGIITQYHQEQVILLELELAHHITQSLEETVIFVQHLSCMVKAAKVFIGEDIKDKIL